MNTKLTPRLRFKEFTSVWNEKLLKSISNIYDGTHQTPNYVNTGIPFYSVEQVTSNNFADTKYISPLVYQKESKKVKIEKGDILMTRIGDVGTAKFIDWDVEASFYVSLSLIKCKSGINARYLTQYINSPFFQHNLWKKTIHVAFPKKVNLGDIGNCKVILPEIEEQKRIAEFLNTVDNYIRNLKSQKEELEKYKKGMMQKIFSREIRFKDGNGNDYPDWEIKKLEQVSKINPSTKKLPDSFIYIDLESVENGVLLKLNRIVKNAAPSRAQRVLVKGDILFQTVRPYQRNNLLFNHDGDYVASTGYAQIKSQIKNTYLYQYLHTDEFVNKVLARCTGTSYPAINSSDLKTLHIRVPVSEEQEKIANVLNSTDDLLNKKNEQITELTLWKKGLMQEMFV